MNTRNSLLASFGFLFFYGSGYIVAKIVASFASAPVFLLGRYGLASILFIVLFIIKRPQWPSSWKQCFHLSISGLGYSAFSLFTFAAMHKGMSPSLAALIVSLQPMLVSLGARISLNERFSLGQILGFLLGFLGVAIALYEGMDFHVGSLIATLFTLAGLLSLTLSNLYQKKFAGQSSLISTGIIQSLSSSLLLLIVALFADHWTIHWSTTLVVSWLWISIGLSMLSISLLWLLLRHKPASNVASLFYLVPAVTAIEEMIYFQHLISLATLIGLVVTLFGLLLVNKKFPAKKLLRLFSK